MIAFLARRSPLITSIGYLLSGTILARLLTAAALILIARQVGPSQFGQYTACFTVAWLTSPFFSLGLDNWLLGHGRRSGTDAELSIHASSALTLKALLGIVWLCCIGLVAPLLNPDAFPMPLLLLAAICVWCDELGRVVWAVFQTAQRNRSTLMLMVLMQALIFASVGVFYLQDEKRALTYTVFQTIATALGSLLGILWQIRRFGFHFQRSELLPTARAAIPFGVSVGLALIYGRVDIALVAQWLGQSDAGLYAPAVSLITALGLIPLVLYNVYLPILSIAYEQDRQELWRLLRQALSLSVAIGLFLGGAVALLSGVAVDFLYGADYAATGTVLAILSGVLVVRAISLSAAAGLIALNRQGQRVRFQFVAALFNIVANLAVLNRWGILGVAVVFVLSEGGLMLAYLGMLWRASAKDRTRRDSNL